MWAYESVFYQIYPLGFCGAPFENDGVEVNRIQKVIDWIPHIKSWEQMQSTSRRCLNLIRMAIIQEIIQRSISVLARMQILPRYVMHYIRKVSVLCWTACSIMWAEDSGHFRMFYRTGKTHVIKTGLPGSISAAIPIIMTASGMKAGKATMIWSN